MSNPFGISEETLGEFLFKQWVMKPDSLLGRNVRSPMHFCRKGQDLSRIFRIESESCETPINSDALTALLKEAVRQTIGNRKEIGVFLSGGLDSSAIAVIAKEFGVKVTGVVYRYSDLDLKYEGISDDYQYARMLCEREGFRLLEVDARKAHIGLLREVIRVFPSPIADPMTITTYLVAREMGKVCNYTLSGHGGDELLGGYLTYKAAISESIYGKYIPNFVFETIQRVAKWRQGATKNPSRKKFYRDLERFSEGALYDFPFNHERFRSYFTVEEVNKLVGSRDWLSRYFEKIASHLSLLEAETTKLQKLQFLDLYGTLDSHNIDVSVFSCKAANIEVGFPFLNEALMTYCFHLPDEMKISRNHLKYLFRESARSYLPEEILNRKKAGFSMPIRSWFDHDLDEIMGILTSNNAMIRQFLDPRQISKVIANHLDGLQDNSMKIWILLTLEFFLQAKIKDSAR